MGEEGGREGWEDGGGGEVGGRTGEKEREVSEGGGIEELARDWQGCGGCCSRGPTKKKVGNFWRFLGLFLCFRSLDLLTRK